MAEVVRRFDRFKEPQKRSGRMWRGVDEDVDVGRMPSWKTVSKRADRGWSDRLPASELLSRRAIHIRLSDASTGSSMTGLPSSKVFALIAVVKKASSRLRSSVITACGCMNFFMCPNAAETLTSIRKSELQGEKSGRASRDQD